MAFVMQAVGVGKPPDGRVTKSWQMQNFWQQKGPLVVATAQTKSLLQCESFRVPLLTVSLSEQSSSVLQVAV
ncbi:MAG TPA: hypothetical protein VLT58_15535, partial [Polyangia bacterium]|nr:hypothetical protein [Polyangia bacterium]